MKISVIIPTLNASEYLGPLFDILSRQTLKADEIVIVDSDSDDDTLKVASSNGNVRILSVERKDFDHGRTRDMALRSCDSDIILFLTQDALPANEHYIENIIKPFKDDKVAGVSGRQLPRKDAREYEKLVRQFNYPEKSNVRDKSDIQELGIKAFFFSDACSAISREKYIEIGGYDYPVKTDEDLFFAAKALKAGYKIAYEADAEVIHSHNLTLKEEYDRNYIQGIEFKKHAKLLEGVSLESEGMKMVKFVTKELMKKGKIISVIQFYFDCAARLLGSKAGRR